MHSWKNARQCGRTGEDRMRNLGGTGTRRRQEMERRKYGDMEMTQRNTKPSGHIDTDPSRVAACPCLHISPSGRPPVPSPQLRVSISLALSVILLLMVNAAGLAQGKRPVRKGSHSSSTAERMSPEARELVERAINVVCLERKQDPKGSVPIDDMQGRPSLPIYSPEAVAGAERARRLLPLAKDLVIGALRQLSAEYGLDRTKGHQTTMQRAIARVRMVKRVKPDMDSRDNASVFLGTPHTITFGTIFLAGLPSDEGMISVLAHELMHIADGDRDSLGALFRAVGRRASSLTNMKIDEQKAEELTSDLVGAMAVRSFVSNTPDYDPLPRRISRSLAHNCVEEDEGDEDHLSPRDTVRALLSLRPQLAHELVYGQPPSPSRK